jgi:hypothetical protein
VRFAALAPRQHYPDLKSVRRQFLAAREKNITGMEIRLEKVQIELYLFAEMPFDLTFGGESAQKD